MKIIIASNNESKIKEFKNILVGYDIQSQKDFNIVEIDEPHDTFVENALRKARHLSSFIYLPVISDDSGLIIAENPQLLGVHTAHYKGKCSSDIKVDSLLDEMKYYDDRTATYITVLVYLRYEKDPNPIIIQEEIKGKITFEKRGSNGFLYDKIFELDNGKTLAELSDNEKNEISPRGKAIRKLVSLL